MEKFLDWNTLSDYVTFIGIVFSIVAFSKNLPWIKSIPTRLWSFIISFFLLIVVNIHGATFNFFDLILYAINAILISASTNGIADANNKNKEANNYENNTEFSNK